jgi:hypothetical protein
MNKTLHKTITKQSLQKHLPASPTGVQFFETFLAKAAGELLQPRPEAVANLLKLAKDI